MKKGVSDPEAAQNFQAIPARKRFEEREQSTVTNDSSALRNVPRARRIHNMNTGREKPHLDSAIISSDAEKEEKKDDIIWITFNGL